MNNKRPVYFKIKGEPEVQKNLGVWSGNLNTKTRLEKVTLNEIGCHEINDRLPTTRLCRLYT